LLQLHGGEAVERVAALKTRTGIKVMKTIPVAEATDIAGADAYLGVADWLMFDAKPPKDMKNAVEKIRKTGNDKVILTERGVSFGYNTLVNDFRALVIMRDMGVPVVFDATHSVQQPGGLGHASGGERKYVAALARAAVAVGCDGLFMEVHEDPDKALSDGPNMVPLSELKKLLSGVLAIHEVANGVC